VSKSNHYVIHPLNALGNTIEGRGLGIFEHFRIFGNPHVYGNETTTKYQIVLEEGKLYFPLSNHLQYYDWKAI
jgi:hypothetical protein